MSDDRQTTLGGGEADTDDASGGDDPETNDFGEELGENETKGGYNRYDVSSLLQKAVRRSDEECAAWAAWELVRSGYAWNLWDRLALYIVEDLRAGEDVALLVDRYERLANDRWEPGSWEGRLCAIHAALTAARATSTREATYANDFFERAAQERAAAREAGREPAQDFPVGDLGPGGEFDVIFDQHTYAGAKKGPGRPAFRRPRRSGRPSGRIGTGSAVARAEPGSRRSQLYRRGTLTRARAGRSRRPLVRTRTRVRAQRVRSARRFERVTPEEN